jgi:hypothetical protein
MRRFKVHKKSAMTHKIQGMMSLLQTKAHEEQKSDKQARFLKVAKGHPKDKSR